MNVKVKIVLLNTTLWIIAILLVCSLPFQFIEFTISETNKIKNKVEKLFYTIHYKIKDLKKVITNP